ncbi:septin and tuftelin interacting protein isoform X1 [Bombyx mori]|uniref:G-patch domain-containing protein n=1 Tax=Bombyx mori TaxID=7091 RepID=A0A8R2C8P5_BOMMO|nr:septin and tuftelin interacting protein isoform X1 [Bombyx mori]
MSDDEVIKFEITDYDLDNEFNPGRGRKANKEQQIYGVWAKDSDDDENEDNVRQRIRKPKDFSAPIGFVAGGVQQAGKKKDKTKEIKPAEASTSAPKYSDSSDEEPEVPVASDTAGIRRQGQGMRPPSLGGNVGNWEKHTKGIGAKLLLQMGYQPGKGLGKDLQGISAPVEATLRKGRGAIGAYGPEKATIKAKKEEERRIKDKEDQDKDKTEKNYNWKKSHKGRYFYRDAADVIQEGKPTTYTIASNELSRVPVIDMTGKEKRVLSGYHALRAQAPRYEHEPRRKCQNFSAPQLVHNLEVMVECCEQDIIQNARELQQAEDEIVVLERDIDECDQQLKEHDEVIGKVQAILEKVEELNKPDVSLEKAHQVLASLKETYPAEYEMLGLGTIAGNIVSPLLSALLATWSPLENPEEPLPVFVKWKQVLTEEAFNSLLWQHYVPHISNAVESWNPRTPEPMVQALTSWRAVCPAWLLSSCASRYVVSRVLAAVRVWDPTRDTQPVHQWVLPWHELAGESLSQAVYPLIRSRLSSALSAWHPADGSARGVLRPWKEAWGGALVALLHRHVLPKLEHCLMHAPLDLVGGENSTSAWQWCVEWREVAGAAALGALAGRTLLARWLAALAAWLNTNPPHATVINSYTEFKKMFPEDILKEPAVRDAFRKALDMMNRSADIDTIDPPPPPRFTVITETKETPRIVDVLASATQQKSFSELLETRCIENGITFVPIAGKTREGRPLYKIGALQCYVIRNVIMYSDDNGRNFAPIAIDKLLKLVED